jgi:hypothetical protein
MMNLNAGMIANLEVIIPPLELQNQYIAFAEAADKSQFVETHADSVFSESVAIGGWRYAA